MRPSQTLGGAFWSASSACVSMCFVISLGRPKNLLKTLNFVVAVPSFDLVEFRATLFTNMES